jgi:hypothetical protein
MTRIVQQHPTLAARFLPGLVVATLVVLLLASSAAEAALTTGKCLGQKRTAWITLRKCQGTEQVKQFNGKPADPAKCQTTFQEKLARISAKATKAAIDCRYGDNGDGTVTDFDTGLQWEQKDGAGGGPSLDNPHDVDNLYKWSLPADIFRTGTAFTDFLARLDGSESSDGVTEGLCFVGHCDWRLPTIVELRTIVDFTTGACSGASGACIDPIFGPTVVGYWSATTGANNQLGAWIVSFFDGSVGVVNKDNSLEARAVRTGL